MNSQGVLVPFPQSQHVYQKIKSQQKLGEKERKKEKDSSEGI